MARAIVILLMVANLGFAVWSAGWLGGVRPGHEQREPARLDKQVHPELIRLGAAPAAAAPAPAPAASVAAAPAKTECLEAGPFNRAELGRAQAALAQAAVPADSWEDVPVDQAGTFLVYLGRYADAEQLARKEEEVKRLRLSSERLQDGGELQPGLVLGRYTSRSEADDALGLMIMRGLQGARVVASAPAQTAHMLRVERASAALKAQLAGLKAAAFGSGFGACK